MALFDITEAILLKVTGRDSQRYLNARLTNDIKLLSIGDTCSAAALTPQGKTQGFFQVLAAGKEEYLLGCDGGDRSTVIAALKKYIVADRVTVEDLSDSYGLIHYIIESTSPLPEIPVPSHEQKFAALDSVYAYQRKRSEMSGFDVLGPKNQITVISQMAIKSGERVWPADKIEYERIAAGVPSFPSELNEDQLFSNAEIFHAISFKKGCYVGQEVVEKIDSHGKSPYRLARLQFPPSVTFTKGADVHTAKSSRSIGEILSVARDNNRPTLCFALLKNDGTWSPGNQVSVDSVDGTVIS